MRTDEVREALLELEQAMGFGHPVGGSELPDEIRFFRILSSLRDALCPRFADIARAADGNSGDLIAAISDCIISIVGKFPVPATTIAKHIFVIGFDRFCAEPSALLEGGPDDSGSQ